MYLGRIAGIGDTATIHDTPSHPYTQALALRRPRRRPVRPRPARPPPHAHRRATLPPHPTPGCHSNLRCWLAQPRCRHDPPPPRQTGDAGRFSACHVAEEAVRRA
ncbi:hypothetical protein [Actinophytocola sp.]|uniref:ABC transporter ATP-binding protein n=1 Tax=Actinophytocola sp. TaxID=1872138 RepID=UPI0039C8AF9C